MLGIDSRRSVFAIGKISKRKSQTETERIATSTDLQAAAKRLAWTVQENNPVRIRMQHEIGDRDALHIIPRVTPAPYPPHSNKWC